VAWCGGEANEQALRLRQEELEIDRRRASDWHEAAEKARYLLNLFAASPGGLDPRRRQLIHAVLENFDRLSREL
jgi:hypothetical protein